LTVWKPQIILNWSGWLIVNV